MGYGNHSDDNQRYENNQFLVKCTMNTSNYRRFKLDSSTDFKTFMRKLLKTYSLEKPVLDYYQFYYELADSEGMVRFKSEDEYNCAIENMLQLSRDYPEIEITIKPKSMKIIRNKLRNPMQAINKLM